MRVLVVGSGGREHALAWRLAQSPSVTEIFSAPGNSGTAQLGANLHISDTDLDGIVAASIEHAVELVVVGPETPLALGLSDRLNAAGIPAFGPTRAAAQLESSKSFARSVMDAAGVPGPNYRVFQNVAGALNYVRYHDSPVVVKADGLAAGKGVAMCANREDAQFAIRASMEDRAFGDAGETVVIEDWLRGPEVSVFGFTDGESLSPVVAAADYKRIGEGGTGPNTGGMGSYGPPHFWNDEVAQTIREEFMLPVIWELDQRGAQYRGALYCGLMLTDSGPRVLEFNCRFGDPETQVIIPQLLSDPAEVMLACTTGSLADIDAVRWSNRPAVAVVMVSNGYPGAYQTGYPVAGLDDDKAEVGTLVFHAGTRFDDNGETIMTAGGRVLACVGTGDTIQDARDGAYQRAVRISFEGAYYRRDIAAEAINLPVAVG